MLTLTKAAARTLMRQLSARQAIAATSHFRQQLTTRGFTVRDAYRVLRTGSVERKPRWDVRQENFEVRVRGRTTDGRDTRVVLGVRPPAHAAFVTIVHIGAGR